MRRADKATRIAQQLEELYPETPVPLDHSDPFTLLIAVLLLGPPLWVRLGL